MTRLLLYFSVFLASFTSVQSGGYVDIANSIDQSVIQQACSDQSSNDQSTEDSSSIPCVLPSFFAHDLSTQIESRYALGQGFLAVRLPLIRAPPLS